MLAIERVAKQGPQSKSLLRQVKIGSLLQTLERACARPWIRILTWFKLWGNKSSFLFKLNYGIAFCSDSGIVCSDEGVTGQNLNLSNMLDQTQAHPNPSLLIFIQLVTVRLDLAETHLHQAVVRSFPSGMSCMPPKFKPSDLGH